jgi:beta-phosphoglucomutase
MDTTGLTMTHEIHALIFDLDGVIADTIELHYLSWKRLADEENVLFTHQDNDRLRGLPRRESLDIFVRGRHLDEDTAQQWMQRKNGYFHEYLAHFSPANRLPGVARLLDEARAAGLKLGVGSASKNAHAVLERLELLDAFDVIGDAHAVMRHKPAPDVFLWVAERLGVLPAQTLTFEDSSVGVEAALAGGFWVVGLGTAAVGQAHVVLPDLVNVNLQMLLAQLDEAI